MANVALRVTELPLKAHWLPSSLSRSRLSSVTSFRRSTTFSQLPSPRIPCSTSPPSPKSAFLGSNKLFSPKFLSPIPGSKKMSTAPSAIASTVGLTKPSPPVIPKIDFTFKAVTPTEFKGELLAVAVFEDSLAKDDSGSYKDASFLSLDKSLSGLLVELSNEPKFEGKLGQTAAIRVLGFPYKRIAIVGLGKFSQSSATKTWKSLGTSTASLAKESQAESVGVFVLSPENATLEKVDQAAELIVTGISIGSFEDNRFKSESTPIKLSSVNVSGLGDGLEAEKSVFDALRLSSGYILTKQLVNSPANVLTPVTLAQVAEEIALAHSDVLTAKILDEKECEKLGMGAYLGVASASSINPPRFIHLTYKPPSGKVQKKLALIGKGLTFDSGGYNIKAGAGSLIEWMKIDMGGAGAVFGAAKAVGAIQPEGVEVHFIVASCENMISGSGMHPGDILTASNGKTIEINNTDAEGRLTLADALVYASKLKVDSIVDIATLTGACAGALGGEIGGLFSDSDPLVSQLLDAAQSSGDKLCRLPLEENYFEGLKSTVADMKNTGPRFGGPITAALFLKRFVDEEIQWAHIDCAGCMFSEKSGGTGYGAILLAKWVLFNAS